MTTAKNKSVFLAIGLNILLPGLGYMYVGKVIVGIGALLLIFGIYAVTTVDTLLMAWIGLNLIMAIDMIILVNKTKKEIKDAPI